MFVSVSLHFNVRPLILLCFSGKLSGSYELFGRFPAFDPKHAGTDGSSTTQP